MAYTSVQSAKAEEVLFIRAADRLKQDGGGPIRTAPGLIRTEQYVPARHCCLQRFNTTITGFLCKIWHLKVLLYSV